MKEFKQSHRRDDDIAIVNAAIPVHLQKHSENSLLADASIFYGGLPPYSLPATKLRKELEPRSIAKCQV